MKNLNVIISDKKEVNHHIKYRNDRNDNILKKIKTSYTNYITKKLNDSLRFTYKRFLNLNKKVSEDLKKDYNIELMGKTIKQIYEENTPSNRYDILNEEVNNKNKLIIKEIFDKNDETETIKILNTKFIDLFKEDETKKYIINDIKHKEKRKEIMTDIDNLDDYMKTVKYFLENFEISFIEKKGRNHRK